MDEYDSVDHCLLEDMKEDIVDDIFMEGVGNIIDILSDEGYGDLIDSLIDGKEEDYE